MSLPEIAAATEVPAHRLLRLLRGLIWAGIVAEDGAGGFYLVPAYVDLADDSPTSIATDILFHGAFFYAEWGRLEDYLKDDAIPYERVHGRPLFDHLAADPALARLFNRPMAARTLEYVDRIASLPLFDTARHLVDVGGGEGQLLLGILRARPASTGVTFDLEVQRPVATEAIRASALEARCQFAAGDMFSAVPTDGDVYLLKWVLHDWDDAHAGSLLRVLHRDAPAAAQLIIIERLMPDSLTAGAALASADLNMLVLNGGAERTLVAYRTLLQNAGWSLSHVEPVENRYGFHALIAGKSPRPASSPPPG